MPIIRRLATIACLFLVNFAFISCSTLQAILTPPKVVVHAVDVANIGLKGIELEIHVNVENPNSTDLTIDKFKYDFAIGNSRLFNGVFDKKVELKANQISLVTIPVELNFQSSKSAIENYLFKSERTYRITGELTSGLFTVPFTDQGTIEIKK